MSNSSRDYWERRGASNDGSRNHAAHHNQPWTQQEHEMLTELWDGTEATLAELAEILGRTIEACRQRYYTKDSAPTVTRRVTTTTTTTTTEETLLRGWMYGQCDRCGRYVDVYLDAGTALCEDCR